MLRFCTVLVVVASVGCTPVYYKVPRSSAPPTPGAPLDCIDQCRLGSNSKLAACARKCPGAKKVKGSCQSSAEIECVRAGSKPKPWAQVLLIPVYTVVGVGLLAGSVWLLFKLRECNHGPCF